jgi:hypothetical protein
MDFLRTTGDKGSALAGTHRHISPWLLNGFDINLFMRLASKGLLFKPYPGYTRERRGETIHEQAA